jgi:MFS superfamily sulfate permease-like transporter
MSKKAYSPFQLLQKDFAASIVVFLVALPLCLGIALASGAPPLSGLISGIIGGLVIGVLSKSPLSVSGPAAGLVVIVLDAYDTLGSFEALLVAVVLAGLMQVILGFIKAGIIGLYFPSAVIKGMLAAIGLTLILKQIPHLVGFDTDAFGEMEFIQSDGSNTLSFLLSSLQHIQLESSLVGICCLALMVFGQTAYKKRMKWIGSFPIGIAVVLLGVILNQLFKINFQDFYIREEHLVSLPTFEGWNGMVSSLQFPDWTVLKMPKLYLVAGTIALVASLETLLSIEAIDKIDPKKRLTPPNRELLAQGLGNMISGLIGGLPITAVIVRSSANLESGAESSKSTILHGIWLILALFLFPEWINLIPYSALAAILLVVGYKLTKPVLYSYHWKIGLEQFIPFIVTVVAILLTDLLIGIIIGLCVGAFFILKANFKVTYQHIEQLKDERGTYTKIRLSEHISFLNKVSLQHLLDKQPKGSRLILDGSMILNIDHDSLEVIYGFAEIADEREIELTLKSIPPMKFRSLNTH